jgi:hypothetical protein
VTYTVATFEDAFNMLCGDRIGQGSTRTVYDCKLLPGHVVKVENDDFRMFANVAENLLYCNSSEAVQRWLCPTTHLSPDGRLLIMRKARICDETDTLPDQLPAFLSDIKRENFGWIDGRLVCVDYGLWFESPSLRMRKVSWS